jgi:hypothetical protein
MKQFERYLRIIQEEEEFNKISTTGLIALASIFSPLNSQLATEIKKPKPDIENIKSYLQEIQPENESLYDPSEYKKIIDSIVDKGEITFNKVKYKINVKNKQALRTKISGRESYELNINSVLDQIEIIEDKVSKN